MSTPPAQVLDALPVIRDLMASLPAEKRADMARLWSSLRNTLVDQERTIEDLQQRARSGTPFEPPPRPPSSASVIGIRAAIDQAIIEAAEVENTTEVFRAINSLPVAWLRQKLDGDRDPSRNNTIGCWFSSRSASHKEYVKLNLRNTLHPVTKQPIGVQPYVHQLAIVADNRGGQLYAARNGGTHQVSHLCHNGGCYNPRHLVVEVKELNLARNTCQGRYIVVAPDKTTINPCEHWNWCGNGSYRQCHLPVREVPAEMRGKWVDSV